MNHSQVQGSLFVGQTPNLQNESSQQHHTSSTRHGKEKPYFIIKDDQKQIYPASMMPTDGTDQDAVTVGQSHSRLGQYERTSQQRSDKNHIELAKCLMYVFEKAINVQFADYHDRLQSQ